MKGEFKCRQCDFSVKDIDWPEMDGEPVVSTKSIGLGREGKQPEWLILIAKHHNSTKKPDIHDEAMVTTRYDHGRGLLILEGCGEQNVIFGRSGVYFTGKS